MKDRISFYRGYFQGFFIALLVSYVWFFLMHSFLRGRLDTQAYDPAVVSSRTAPIS